MIMHRISVIAKSCHVYADRRLSKYNINNTEQAILMLLQKSNFINQETIAKYFYMDKGTIAKALRKLEQKNMISRKINENNQREKIISITDEGMESMDLMKTVLEDWYECIFKGLTEEEMNSLNLIMEKIANNASTALLMEDSNETDK